MNGFMWQFSDPPLVWFVAEAGAMVRISEVCRACLLLSLVSPAQVAADPFRFISIGDWGTGGRNQVSEAGRGK